MSRNNFAGLFWLAIAFLLGSFAPLSAQVDIAEHVSAQERIVLPTIIPDFTPQLSHGPAFSAAPAQYGSGDPVFKFRSHNLQNWGSEGFGIRVENIQLPLLGKVHAFSEGLRSDFATYDVLVGVEGTLAMIPMGRDQFLPLGWHVRTRFLNPDDDAMNFECPAGICKAYNQTEIIGMVGYDTNAGRKNQRQRITAQLADRAMARIGSSFTVGTVDNMPSQRMAINAIIGEALWLKNWPAFWVKRQPGVRPLDFLYTELGANFSHPIRYYDRNGLERDTETGIIYQTWPDHGLTAWGVNTKVLLKVDARWLSENAPALILNAGGRYSYERQEVREQDLPLVLRDADFDNDLIVRAGVLSLTYLLGGSAAVTAEYQRGQVVGGDRFREGLPFSAEDFRAPRPDPFQMYRLYLRFTL